LGYYFKHKKIYRTSVVLPLSNSLTLWHLVSDLELCLKVDYSAGIGY